MELSGSSRHADLCHSLGTKVKSYGCLGKLLIPIQYRVYITVSHAPTTPAMVRDVTVELGTYTTVCRVPGHMAALAGCAANEQESAPAEQQP